MALLPEHGFFARPVAQVAESLIGCVLLHQEVGGVIVETEAYSRDDPASHSMRGPTARNGAMFGPVGRLYVYRSYGMHWCVNIVCGTEPGCAVLLRAIEPTVGLAAMRARRGIEPAPLLCSGPGRLTQALGITKAQDNAAVTEPPFTLMARHAPVEVVVGPRIGITKAVEKPWRFGLRGSPFLSRRFPQKLSAAEA
jgi:DNA-3-methyladenine glycosylase